MKLRDLTMRQIGELTWVVEPRPLIGPPWPSPIVADPTFLPPAAGRRDWHMWAHSLLGLHHYRSADGLSWNRRETVARNALRPQILDLATTPGPWVNPPARYRLSYEKSRLFVPVVGRWSSWIESRRSDDVTGWSRPTLLLEPGLDWHVSPELGRAVSNPCLCFAGDAGWRLYYSAGLTLIPDCGFPEPTYIGVAFADSPDGPFRPERRPLLSPGEDYANLASGALKVIRAIDGWVGFQNGITWDGTRSSSRIWVLGSEDGLHWHRLADRPAVEPVGDGWMSSHVYALDVRDTDAGPRMYFNARDGAHWTKGHEKIGTAVPVAA